jgi:hypothetical protein
MNRKIGTVQPEWNSCRIGAIATLKKGCSNIEFIQIPPQNYLRRLLMTDLDRNSGNTSDLRTKATYAIWRYATGMFALCIPLVAITRGSVVLPAMVALGAGAGTVAVWRSDRHSKRRLENEQYVRSLEERIANLEAIASNNELDMLHQFKQLELQKRSE